MGISFVLLFRVCVAFEVVWPFPSVPQGDSEDEHKTDRAHRLSLSAASYSERLGPLANSTQRPKSLMSCSSVEAVEVISFV